MAAAEGISERFLAHPRKGGCGLLGTVFADPKRFQHRERLPAVVRANALETAPEVVSPKAIKAPAFEGMAGPDGVGVDAGVHGSHRMIFLSGSQSFRLGQSPAAVTAGNEASL